MYHIFLIASLIPQESGIQPKDAHERKFFYNPYFVIFRIHKFEINALLLWKFYTMVVFFLKFRLFLEVTFLQLSFVFLSISKFCFRTNSIGRKAKFHLPDMLEMSKFYSAYARFSKRWNTQIGTLFNFQNVYFAWKHYALLADGIATFI